MDCGTKVISPIATSKLSTDQYGQLSQLAEKQPEVDIATLAQLITEEVFIGKVLIVPQLLKAIEMLGPFTTDRGKSIWFYKDGVWLPEGQDEVTLRIALCTGAKYRRDFVSQVSSLIKARTSMINGLGPRNLINVRNGMLNWETLELVPHHPDYFSPYQLLMAWNPDAKCQTVDLWFENTFDPEIHKLLWQILGVVWHPSMGFQKAIIFIGDGFNGKGTFLRLASAGLPRSARSSVDPRMLTRSQFAGYELHGKTANICGDIESLNMLSTGEFKKITGDDEIRGERKHCDVFTFINQSTLLFAGNEMPSSNDGSEGWYRRWLIVPMNKKIVAVPDQTLENRLHSELEGVLVKAVHGLREAMLEGAFDNPPICQYALEDYKYRSNSSALFINEQLEFSDSFKVQILKTGIYDKYRDFCDEKGFSGASRPKFYSELEKMGAPHIQDKSRKTSDEKGRGYVGVGYKPQDWSLLSATAPHVF